MRYEYVDLGKKDIGKISPGIVSAQIASLCKEYCYDDKTDSLEKYEQRRSQG